MKKTDIEIYSDLVDNGVVRMPDRKMLGSVIQGDSLFLLHADLIDILESHKHEPHSELFYRIFNLAQSLENRLQHFLDTCRAHDIDVNFDIEFSVEDYKDLIE